ASGATSSTCPTWQRQCSLRFMPGYRRGLTPLNIGARRRTAYPGRLFGGRASSRLAIDPGDGPRRLVSIHGCQSDHC
ncbi:MAG TPA: hypothetical protein VIZ70_07320, partial [Propionibacteriaceae bacterium]